MTDVTTLQVTDAELATLAGVSTRRIRQLVEAGKLQRVGRNRYNLAEAFQALLDEMSTPNRAGELTAERVRKLRAEASLAELDLAKATGEVALIREFELVCTAMDTAIRSNILNVPARAEIQLLGCTDPAEFKAKLRAELILALDTAANTDLEVVDDE